MSVVSITALEKSVQKLAEKLEEQGVDYAISVFKSGRYSYLGASYVELSVEQGDAYENVHFLANGYGACSAYELDGSIREMKAEFFRRLKKAGFKLKRWQKKDVQTIAQKII